MKISIILTLLGFVFLQDSAAESCIGKTVKVVVINAHHMSGDGLSRPDPYIKITVGGETEKTKVIHNTRSPVWFEHFKFYSPNSNIMTIEVWDKDSGFRGGDDHIGTCMEEMHSNGMDYTYTECDVKHRGVVKLKYKCT
ncbi:perforin-1-like [Gouania willdenowi]|uniref:Perforin-1-like n=1 Tax=Gouania willdenowi TaxID=441366 RepID=A0A8C5HWD5_GOUWI|nr:perforin-1-like [Gouania willdenowi]